MLEDIFQEVVSWEKKPISELLGTVPVIGSDYSKQIIMYGPTQVGKTTLILDLIGIKPEKRNELDNILRGGSTAGSASTSSAIIYSKWDKDCFGISTRNIHDFKDETPEELNAVQMAERITAINVQNRFGDKATLKQSDIYCFYFPASYFDDLSPLKNLQIIDLPGFGERNEKMRKRADEIASFISGFVAGAIVVVRSQNIQKLESDYKEFISKHHLNHLAIAVSYAAATNFNVRKFQGDDSEIAHEISEYYYNLIQTDGYMNFGDVAPEDIIFPVEKKEFLNENLPSLYGAFEKLRSMLIEKIASMNNGTAIKFCIEKLELRNAELFQEKEKAKQEKAVLIRHEKDYQNNLNLIKESKKSFDEESQNVKKRVKSLNKTKRILKKRANSFSQKSFTNADAENIWAEISSKSDTDRRNYVYSELRKYVNECIGAEEEFFNKTLYGAVRKTAEKVLNDFDVNDFLKARGFARHGKKWCEYAVLDVALFIEDLSQSIVEVITKTSKELFDELKPGMRNVRQKQSEQRNAISILEDKINENHRKHSSVTEYINDCEKQIQNNIMSKENVEAVFVKHFYLKKQELEERIENEPCDEVKTALFLVLSSIYLNMKSYLKEKNKDE